MIRAKLNSWLYYRALDLPAYRYLYHYEQLGQTIVVFGREAN
jgi:hypothetical protein